MSDKHYLYMGLGVVGVLVALVMLLVPPIPQALSYHLFIDQRAWAGVPNFLNVFSNALFLLAGLLGLSGLLRNRYRIVSENRPAYLIFFIGVALVAIGSGYYHVAPDNATLVWDRLPMTIAFMSLVSIVIGEYFSPRWARLLLWPLLIAGFASVLYWHLSERVGRGDLRPYAMVQFLPVLMLPWIFWRYRHQRNASGYWLMIGCYVLAKLFEHFDVQIYAALGESISGHSLKHLAAAFGVFGVIRQLRGADIVGAENPG